MAELHRHRAVRRRDFLGKTVLRFEPSADNIWRFWFTDGSSFALQCETSSDGIAYMEICEACGEK